MEQANCDADAQQNLLDGMIFDGHFLTSDCEFVVFTVSVKAISGLSSHYHFGGQNYQLTINL